ncbi:hypothetical protein BCR37DRAFT_382403 [Protomyces lactucae-debilis]|uniref:Uncharacterized protein n=1 Tax=Protomyces lactucae-debilis TaxID=2754530 RepID=A0A1Y2F2R8_PROLT|nr:uncharacterized protein BCR37DRAFT_382403 [Protomyces lactucae-debilis]ORY78143.1 hypothetical protein BCR37DRAFT_382403 [Protomyces lactucae-debilis]
MIILSRHSTSPSCVRTSLWFLTILATLVHLMLSLQALEHLSSASAEAVRRKVNPPVESEYHLAPITKEELHTWFGSENVFPAKESPSRKLICYDATFSFLGLRNSESRTKLPQDLGPIKEEKNCKAFCNAQLENHARRIGDLFHPGRISSSSCLRSGAFELRSRAVVIHAPGALCNDFFADNQRQCPYAKSTCACEFTVYAPAVQMTRVKAKVTEEAPNGQYYISPRVSLQELQSHGIPANNCFPRPPFGKCGIENIAASVNPVSETSSWELREFKVVEENFDCSREAKINRWRQQKETCDCSRKNAKHGPLQCKSHNEVSVKRVSCQFQSQNSPHRQDVGSSHQQPNEAYATSAHDYSQPLNTTMDLDVANFDACIAAFQAEFSNEPPPGQESSSRQGEGVCPVNSMQCQPLQFAEHERNPVTFFPFNQHPWMWSAYKDDQQVQQFYSDHYTQVDPNNPVAESSNGQFFGSSQLHHQAPGTSQWQNPGSGEWQNEEQPGQTQWQEQGQCQWQDQEQNQGQDQGQNPLFNDWPWPSF